MHNFDLKSGKYIAIVIVICIVFVAAVSNAYKYLPSDENVIKDIQEETTVEDNANTSRNELREEDSERERNSSREVVQFEPEEEVTIEDITEYAPEYEGRNVEDIQNSAKFYRETRQYSKAAAAYKAIIAISHDSDVKAQGYEDIATLYAMVKKYNTAISYAQKAYSINPNINREFLLARLYYKSGDVEKAKSRIDKILNQDF